MSGITEREQMAASLIFNKYDFDQNGYLDIDEIEVLIRDAQEQMGVKQKITDTELKNFMGKFNSSKKGLISES